MPNVPNEVGFGRSNEFTARIASGAVLSTPVDLGRGYAAIVVLCDDCAGFTDPATISAKVAYSSTGQLNDLYEVNDPGVKWTKDTPTSGSLAFLLSHAFGARRVQFVINQAATQDIDIKIHGLDPVVSTPS